MATFITLKFNLVSATYHADKAGTDEEIQFVVADESGRQFDMLTDMHAQAIRDRAKVQGMTIEAAVQELNDKIAEYAGNA